MSGFFGGAGAGRAIINIPTDSSGVAVSNTVIRTNFLTVSVSASFRSDQFLYNAVTNALAVIDNQTGAPQDALIECECAGQPVWSLQLTNIPDTTGNHWILRYDAIGAYMGPTIYDSTPPLVSVCRQLVTSLDMGIASEFFGEAISINPANLIVGDPMELDHFVTFGIADQDLSITGAQLLFFGYPLS
jgi:hypothetical protein